MNKQDNAVKFGSRLWGNKLTVFDNRVEIVTGMFPFKRKNVIPFKNIASVDKPQFLNQVIITTNDGKKHKYSVGNASKVRQVIVDRM